ncbi:MAG: hypothetical protein FH762_07895 [Firmicutes bacterium]|nr:hypothetical protein [Bacillota bacterium]
MIEVLILKTNEIPEGYVLIPSSIYEDNRLKAHEIALLSTLYSQLKRGQDRITIANEEILKTAGLTKGEYLSSLKKLKAFDWLIDVKVNKIDTSIVLKNELSNAKEDEIGSRIARAWNKHFGTRLIKYTDLEDLLDFVINRDMEEELILKVMEYSGEKADGDPFLYCRAILINLSRNGVLTLKEYEKKEEEKGEFHNGKQISGFNREKDGQHEDEIARGYYKKGYR